MKAIGYIRVSTDEQATEGVSLAAQRARIESYASMRGLEIVAVVSDEGVSAGKPLASRPGGRELLRRVRKGEATAVIAWKLDRLFRDVVDCLGTVRAWDRKGAGLHLIDLGGMSIDTGSAMGTFFLTMLAAMAEWERKVIGERTAAGLAQKRRMGERVGSVPYGYRDEAGKLEPDVTEQGVIAEILAMHRSGMSRRAIVAELNAGDYPARGARWHLTTVGRILAKSH